MQGKPSGKFKYIQGHSTFPKKEYFDLVTPLQGVEGNQICANSKFVAVPWKGGGGPFTVFPVENMGKVLPSTPLFNGHTGLIQDLEFSPFHEHMLATASADTSLRL